MFIPYKTMYELLQVDNGYVVIHFSALDLVFLITEEERQKCPFF